MATPVRRQLNEKLNRLVRQPGGDSLRQDENGGLEATVVYKCAWERVLALMPRRNVARHPDFSDLYCKNVSVTREPPGIAIVTAVYTGLSGSDAGSGGSGQFEPTTDLAVTLRQEPIETHPDFESVIGGTKDDPKNDAKFDSDGLFKGFGSGSSKFGVTDYLTPGGQYRRVYLTRTPPTNGNVGSIATPTGAPDFGGSYTWLDAGLSWTRQGGYYRVSEEYLLSGPKGWDDDIY